MDISIVLPAHNEEKNLKQNLEKVFNFCKNNLTEHQWQVIVADNASVDQTKEIILLKQKKYSNLEYFYLPKAGKGRAVIKAWQKYPAQIQVMMDADLSADLKCLPALINPILSQQADIVIGSRYLPGSQLKRPLFRSIISKIYNLLFRLLFWIKIKDLQCGFKAINGEKGKNILNLVQDHKFFFDTELIVLSNYLGLKIKEIPITWSEDKGRISKVKIFETGFYFIYQIIKLKLRLLNKRNFNSNINS